MLVTASTVKDTLPNLERFVAGNLAGGADLMVVFLDAPDPEVEAFLDDHPHVVVVPTGDDWWQGDRPAALNVRQRINANVAKAALTTTPWAEWVFHVDADEVVQVDRRVLAGVPAGSPVVRLAPLEAVSRKRWDAEPTWFKRLLGQEELTLLHVLGVIDRPANGALFHGHVAGKSGIRPDLDLWLTLHHGVDAEGTELERWSHDDLAVLHFESVSGEEFVRKWTSILASGPRAAFRPAREPTAVALQTLLGRGLTPEQAEPYLMRIFERTTEDDFETLHDLGLLVQVDPRAGTHVPALPPPGGREQLDETLARLRDRPKRPFHPGRPAAEVAAMLHSPGGVRRLFGRRG